jgi:hypothetical protein
LHGGKLGAHFCHKFFECLDLCDCLSLYALVGLALGFLCPRCLTSPVRPPQQAPQAAQHGCGCAEYRDDGLGGAHLCYPSLPVTERLALL